MKNADKILYALREAFPGHAVEYQYKAEANVYSIFLDRIYIGQFNHDFFIRDDDNPEIEIKIKATVRDLSDFLWQCEGSGGVAVVMKEVERGLDEWQKESRRNS